MFLHPPGCDGYRDDKAWVRKSTVSSSAAHQGALLYSYIANDHSEFSVHSLRSTNTVIEFVPGSRKQGCGEGISRLATC